ncbi:MAG: hypothetical protein IKW00_07170 [Clostridia bacterium]|nr:hypothetical protein [Clostridia bacterium]
MPEYKTVYLTDGKVPFFENIMADAIICDSVLQSADAENILFAQYRKKQSAYVFCFEAAAHSADRFKERVIASAVENGREAAYLNWLVTENHFVSALLAAPDRVVLEESEAVAALCDWKNCGVVPVKDFSAHLEAYLAMHEGVRAILPTPAYLCGLNTVKECMEDEFVRDFAAHALADEIAPQLSLSREEALRYAADVFIALGKEGENLLLTDLAENSVSRYARYVLPMLARHVQNKKSVPPCLCFALSALIMFYAGARDDGKGGYQGVREEAYYPIRDEEEVMHTFSRMSCDMDCDSMAYAVLSDWEMWNNDLRNVPGLLDGVTGQVRDIQLLGSKTALKIAAEQHD